MDEPPPQPEEHPAWELPVKWVVITAIVLWLFGIIGLVIYLLGPRGLQ